MSSNDIQQRVEESFEVGDVLRGPGRGHFSTICEVGNEHIVFDSTDGPFPVVLNYDDDEESIEMFLECEVLDDGCADQLRVIDRYAEIIDACVYHMSIEATVDDAVKSVCDAHTFEELVVEDICEIIRDDSSFDVAE